MSPRARVRGLAYHSRMGIRSLFFVLVVANAGCGGCDGDNDNPDASPDAIDYSLGEHPALAIACADSLADVYTLPTGLPAMDDTHRGDVFHCALAEKMTVPEIQAAITASNAGYMNTSEGTVNSGFWSYRIAYRTTRNTVSTVREEGDTAAIVFIPAKPIAGAPLVVWGHGSVGVASKCAPSRLNFTMAPPDADYPPIVYRLVSYGYTVIAPDYSGFSYNQTPGYFNAEDEAHSILDSTRAAAKVLPSPPTSVVFVGHSQGGHAVLAAQSYSKSYGMQGNLVGVAALAPLWNSMSIWAAATTDTAGLTTTSDVNAILYAMEYAYSAGELREGTGHGVDVFQTAKQAGAKDAILGGECWDAPKLQALGTRPSDFFTPEYVGYVGGSCAINYIQPDCSNALAAKWKSWWMEDRPPIEAMSSPITLMFGGMDGRIPAGRAACMRRKIDADLAAVSGATTTVQYCSDPAAGHSDIVRGPSADYVNKWIAARTGAGADPGGCTAQLATATCEPYPIDW